MPVKNDPSEPFGSLVARNGSPPPLEGASGSVGGRAANGTEGVSRVDRASEDPFGTGPSGGEGLGGVQETSILSQEAPSGVPRDHPLNEESESRTSIGNASETSEGPISLGSSEYHPPPRPVAPLPGSNAASSNRRATLDVDAFTRLMVTGDTGAAPAGASQGDNHDENRPHQDTSSFETPERTRSQLPESRRTSTVGVKVPPPPPKPRHGRPLSHRVVSSGAQVSASFAPPKPTPPPRDRIEEKTNAWTSTTTTTTTTTPDRRLSSLSPDISPNSSEVILTPQESSDGSPRMRKPPTPPLARRASHVRRTASRTLDTSAVASASSASSSTSATGVAPSTAQAPDSRPDLRRSPASSPASTPPAYPKSSKPLPVPPSPRNASGFPPASVAHGGHDSSSIREESTAEEQDNKQSISHTTQALPQPQPSASNSSNVENATTRLPAITSPSSSAQSSPRTSISGPRVDLRSQTETQPRSSPRSKRVSMMMPAPPPPPPRRAGVSVSMRGSSDAHHSSPTTSRKSSQSSPANPTAVNQTQRPPLAPETTATTTTTMTPTTKPEPPESPLPHASHAADILADLSQLQQEVDACRGQYERETQAKAKQEG